jgi:hypothetical protein
MATVDRTVLEDWLHQELDGELTGLEQQQLEQALAGSEELRLERKALQSLDQQLALSRISVREGFADEVLADLPPAAWESRSRRAWRAPLAMLAALVAVVLGIGYGAGTGSAAAQTGLVGALASVVDLFQTAVLAGTGLLGFSWKGLRLAFQELLLDQPAAFAGMVLLLVGLNVLLYLGLRRHRRPGGAVSRSSKDS